MSTHLSSNCNNVCTDGYSAGSECVACFVSQPCHRHPSVSISQKPLSNLPSVWTHQRTHKDLQSVEGPLYNLIDSTIPFSSNKNSIEDSDSLATIDSFTDEFDDSFELSDDRYSSQYNNTVPDCQASLSALDKEDWLPNHSFPSPLSSSSASSSLSFFDTVPETIDSVFNNNIFDINKNNNQYTVPTKHNQSTNNLINIRQPDSHLSFKSFSQNINTDNRPNNNQLITSDSLSEEISELVNNNSDLNQNLKSFLVPSINQNQSNVSLSLDLSEAIIPQFDLYTGINQTLSHDLSSSVISKPSNINNNIQTTAGVNANFNMISDTPNYSNESRKDFGLETSISQSPHYLPTTSSIDLSKFSSNAISTIEKWTSMDKNNNNMIIDQFQSDGQILQTRSLDTTSNNSFKEPVSLNSSFSEGMKQSFIHNDGQAGPLILDNNTQYLDSTSSTLNKSLTEISNLESNSYYAKKPHLRTRSHTGIQDFIAGNEMNKFIKNVNYQQQFMLNNNINNENSNRDWQLNPIIGTPNNSVDNNTKFNTSSQSSMDYIHRRRHSLDEPLNLQMLNILNSNLNDKTSMIDFLKNPIIESPMDIMNQDYNPIQLQTNPLRTPLSSFDPSEPGNAGYMNPLGNDIFLNQQSNYTKLRRHSFADSSFISGKDFELGNITPREINPLSEESQNSIITTGNTDSAFSSISNAGQIGLNDALGNISQNDFMTLPGAFVYNDESLNNLGSNDRLIHERRFSNVTSSNDMGLNGMESIGEPFRRRTKSSGDILSNDMSNVLSEFSDRIFPKTYMDLSQSSANISANDSGISVPPSIINEPMMEHTVNPANITSSVFIPNTRDDRKSSIDSNTEAIAAAQAVLSIATNNQSMNGTTVDSNSSKTSSSEDGVHSHRYINHLQVKSLYGPGYGKPPMYDERSFSGVGSQQPYSAPALYSVRNYSSTRPLSSYDSETSSESSSAFKELDFEHESPINQLLTNEVENPVIDEQPIRRSKRTVKTSVKAQLSNVKNEKRQKRKVTKIIKKKTKSTKNKISKAIKNGFEDKESANKMTNSSNGLPGTTRKLFLAVKTPLKEDISHPIQVVVDPRKIFTDKSNTDSNTIKQTPSVVEENPSEGSSTRKSNRKRNLSYKMVDGSYLSDITKDKDVVQRKYKEDTEDNIYKCSEPGCTKAFGRLYNLKSHMQMHSGDKPFECPTCKQRFLRKHDMHRHFDSRHRIIKRFKCGGCNLGFARMDALKRHLSQQKSSRKGYCFLASSEN